MSAPPQPVESTAETAPLPLGSGFAETEAALRVLMARVGGVRTLRPSSRLYWVPAPRTEIIDDVDEVDTDGEIDEVVADLVERVRVIAEHAVDHYEIAATLESQGITDPIARKRYGQTDVFALAREVQARVHVAESDPESDAESSPPRPPVDGPWRDITHGLIYLLPTVMFPVGVALLHRPYLMTSVVVVGGVGWVWSGISAWLAWHFLGQNRPTVAARVLRTAALLALPLAGVTGALVVSQDMWSASLEAVCVVQMAFQVSSMLLMFYRREDLLFLALTPGILVAAEELLLGAVLLTVAATTVGVSVLLGLGAGLWQTRARGLPEEPTGPVGILRLVPRLLVVLLHTALGAFFLLQAQALFLFGNVAVLVAFLPLVFGMGVVEWRVRRFTEGSRTLLASTWQTERFDSGIRRLLARDLAICAGVIAAASAGLLAILSLTAEVRAAAVVLCAAGVVLGPAYFAGFVLGNAGRSLALCVAFGGAAATLFSLVHFGGWEPTPLSNALAVLGSCVVLAALFAPALALTVREVRNFR